MADQPNDIFSNSSDTNPNPAPVNNGANASTSDELSTLLASIKNERGEPKYKDLTEAFKGLQNAQEFIPSLKTELSQKDAELARLRDENLRLKTVEETVLALTQQRENQTSQPANQGLSAEQIAELVNQSLTKRESQAMQQANLAQVVTTLQQSLGADAGKAFYAKGAELGMSVEEMNALAAKSPKAVLTMFGVSGDGKKPTNVTQSSYNSSAFEPKADSFIGRNTRSVMSGATTEDFQMENDNARKMVEELHAQGLTVQDLVSPKAYNQFFKNRK